VNNPRMVLEELTYTSLCARAMIMPTCREGATRSSFLVARAAQRMMALVTATLCMDGSSSLARVVCVCVSFPSQSSHGRFERKSEAVSTGPGFGHVSPLRLFR
jgi:hypothetical protein